MQFAGIANEIELVQSYPEGVGGSFVHRVWNVIDFLRAQTPLYQAIHVLIEGDPSELRFRDYMIYDRTMSVMAYNEFLDFLAGKNLS